MEIRQLILKTNSLKRTKLFYSRTLELEVLEESDMSISFRAGSTVLSFEETTAEKPFYHFAFNIVNNKFSDSFEWINSKLDLLPFNGMLIAGYDDWNAQSFYFLDNNANILEFIVRFDLPYISDVPFSSACIREISEIGLVVDNVEAKAAELHEQYQIPYFSKGPRLKDFIPLGDDKGLLLLVETKRGWVPTERPAQAFPVTIVDDQDNRIQLH
jgi:catechol 2,3-dioxygenase-like lactoylglutathione lyase family enzyme